MGRPNCEKTISETLFEQFCTDLGIPCARILRTDKATPDYDIELSGHIVVTEVKQCDGDGPASGWEEPGHRVRPKIQQATSQLRARSNGKLPTLLVIFDNGTPSGIDATDIKTAMYGDEKVVITRVGDSMTHVSSIHPGGGRKFTQDGRGSISAIALLHSLGKSLSIFHNQFAAIPIDPDWFRYESFQHFALDPSSAKAIYEWRSV